VDGRVLLCVDEGNRSWCTSSNANDQRAVTIECASDTTAPYAFKDVVYQKLITLCVDICKRNGKKKLLWLGDKNKTLNYSPKSDEMVLTVHRWFANKSCPGDWMYARRLALRLGHKLSDQLLELRSAEHLFKLCKGLRHTVVNQRAVYATFLELVEGCVLVGPATAAAALHYLVIVAFNSFRKLYNNR